MRSARSSNPALHSQSRAHRVPNVTSSGSSRHQAPQACSFSGMSRLLKASAGGPLLGLLVAAAFLFTAPGPTAAAVDSVTVSWFGSCYGGSADTRVRRTRGMSSALVTAAATRRRLGVSSPSPKHTALTGKLASLLAHPTRSIDVYTAVGTTTYASGTLYDNITQTFWAGNATAAEVSAAPKPRACPAPARPRRVRPALGTLEGAA